MVIYGQDLNESSEFLSTSGVYHNSKYSLSLEVPSDWNIVDEKNGIKVIKEKDTVFIDLSVHDLPSVDLNSYIIDTISKRNDGRDDFKLLQLEETTLSENIPAFKSTYTFRSDPDKEIRKVLRYWTATQDKLYSIGFVSNLDKYDTYLFSAQKIIQSLQTNVRDQDTSYMTSTDKNISLAVGNTKFQNDTSGNDNNTTSPISEDKFTQPALNQQNGSDLLPVGIDFQDYDNSTLGLKVLYPVGWSKAENNTDRHTIVSFLSPLDNTTDKVRERLLLRINNQHTDLSLADYSNKVKETLQKNPDFRVIEFNSTLLSGNSAYAAFGIIRQGDYDVNVIDKWTIKDGKVYRIVYYYSNDNLGGYKALGEKMIKSFSITN